MTSRRWPRGDAADPRRSGAAFRRPTCVLVACLGALIGVGGAAASTTPRTPEWVTRIDAPGLADARPPIVVGGEHACALPGDGTVRCWGDNRSGQLGNGFRTEEHAPAGDVLQPPVTVIAAADSAVPLTGVRAITAGFAHTCALLDDGTVRCWGANGATPDGGTFGLPARSGGAVGDGTTTDRLAPVSVIAGPGRSESLSGVTEIVAGSDYTCALLLDTTAACWGEAPGGGSLAPSAVVAAPGSERPLTGILSITAGDAHACAAIVDGTVRCWGSNYTGQLGDGSTTDSPEPVTVVSGPANVPLTGVVALAAGHGMPLGQNGIANGHTCALLVDGTVTCWGSDDVGQIGDGTVASEVRPTAPTGVVDALGSTQLLAGADAIAAGSAHTCALLVTSTVACWGLGFGADNSGAGAPVAVVAASDSSTLLSDVSMIAAGGGATCAVLTDRSVTCWTGSPGPPVGVPDLLVAAGPTPAPTAPATPIPTPSPASSLAPGVTAAPVVTTAPVTMPGLGATTTTDFTMLPGDWRVTYGSSSVVTIAGENGSYTVVAKVPVQVTGSACFLPAGTLIATFDVTGSVIAGQHGLWRVSDCAFSSWAPMTLALAGDTLTARLQGIAERPVFTRIRDAAPSSLRESVPMPPQIILDPVTLAQSLAIAGAMVVLVPFPATLFNSTLEANYSEIVGRLRRARRRLTDRMRPDWLLRLMPGLARGTAEPDDLGSRPAAGDDRTVWRTPVGIVLFLLLSALLYSLLDPATRLDADSVAVCLGLAAGLAITLAAFSIPVAVAYRRRAITFYLRALPGTLAIGLVCVLLTRLTDFHPGYLYGLIVAFVVLREVSDPVEGRAMAQATVAMAVAAVVAWLTLWGVKELFPGGGDTPVGIVGLETALATIVVAGIELLVFGMVPVRFLPGDKIRRWNLIAWAGLFLAGILGFLVVLMNPSSGYLADNARTPLATIVVLFATFAIGSITFWGYFRFRRVPSVQPPV